MAAKFLVWSNQKRMWWRPAEPGYTEFIEEAGRYPRVLAERIVYDATCNGQLRHPRMNPVTGETYAQLDEYMVLAPESIGGDL